MSHNRPLIELPFASISKRVLLRNHSYENAFPLQDHFHHHHLLATLKFNYNINNYVRARRPPRNHQANRGGHLGYVYKFVVEVRLGQFRLDSLKIHHFCLKNGKASRTSNRFSCQSNWFSYERFCTKTRFETEAQSNFEISILTPDRTFLGSAARHSESWDEPWFVFWRDQCES